MRHRALPHRRANLGIQRFQPLGELALALADGPETEGELPAVLQIGLHLAQTHPVLTVEQADLADQPGAHLTSGHPVRQYREVALATAGAAPPVLSIFGDRIASQQSSNSCLCLPNILLPLETMDTEKMHKLRVFEVESRFPIRIELDR